MSIKIALLRDRTPGERRVALVPEMVQKLVNQGWAVQVETGAGLGSCHEDSAYEAVGASVVGDPLALGEAQIWAQIAPPSPPQIAALPPQSVWISLLNPLGQPEGIARLGDRGITAFALELIPRTSRAQSMDVLSSQAAVAGYQATLLAAVALPKFFPMLTTAAGTIRPAKVFVIGAGVAGLQAIATARRLGAMVEAFDIRPAVKEEVQSLGAKFVEVTLAEETATAGGYAKEVSADAQAKTRDLIAAHVAQADVVITTAQVPGKKAPLLVTEAMIAQMRPGSVVIDMAGEQGGNCEGTLAGETVVRHGVQICGPVNLPATIPIHASQMYSKNLLTFLQYLVKDGAIALNFDDDIIDATCVTHGGAIRNERVKQALAVPV